MLQTCFERYCELANKKVEQLVKVSSLCLVGRQFKHEELESVVELSEVCSQIVLRCLYLARTGRLDILWSVNELARWVTQWTQACDRRFARPTSSIHYTRFPTKMSCWKHGKPSQTGFVSRLRVFCWSWSRNQPQVETCVLVELQHLSQSVVCARNKFLSRTVSTESEVISLDVGLRMDGLFALDLWDIVIEVPRSTNNNVEPKHTRIQETDATLHSKTKTPNVQRKTVSVVHFWWQRSRNQNDLKRTKSDDATRVQIPQNCSWLVW